MNTAFKPDVNDVREAYRSYRYQVEKEDDLMRDRAKLASNPVLLALAGVLITSATQPANINHAILAIIVGFISSTGLVLAYVAARHIVWAEEAIEVLMLDYKNHGWDVLAEQFGLPKLVFRDETKMPTKVTPYSFIKNQATVLMWFWGAILILSLLWIFALAVLWFSKHMC